MQYSIPSLIEQFETTTNSTFKELKLIAPKIKLFTNICDSDTIEICEPVFPFYIRKAIVNDLMEITLSFYDYVISDTVDDGFSRMLINSLRTEKYIEEANAEGFFCKHKNRFISYKNYN